MASPPPLHGSQLTNRKRPSISSTTSNAKRRKPSNLRNSFAPDSNGLGTPARFSRSPSVDSSVAGTTVTSGTGGRRRRKGKDGDDARSATGASARGGRSAIDGEGGAEGEEEDDDDEGEGMEAVLEGGGMMDEAADKQEKEHMRILLEALNPDQLERYEIYRRVKLKKEIVRKITNQTLSQSVPQPVIIAINGYTKVFIGELIDRALTVRDEWAASRTHLPNPAIPTALLQASLQKPSNYKPDAKPQAEDIQAAGLVGWRPPTDDKGEMAVLWEKISEDKGLQERLQESDKGPLTPDHLREALRRYKRDRNGGGAGFVGLSLEGTERTAARMGGRPLFR